MDADDLYRRGPEDFTAARDAAAKQARTDGDRDRAAALKALRRPSVAAWVVNRLAQEQPALLAELLDLAPALAQAQAGGDAEALRTLGAQRRALVEAVVGAAVEAAGRTVTTAVREEVAATLEAALADPGSARAVRSGRLVRALAYAGFGEVDLVGAVADGPPPAPSATAPQTQADRAEADRAAADRAEADHAAAVAAAEQAAHGAAGRLDDAVRACEGAERRRAAATTEREARAADVARLERELADARAAQADAEDAENRAAAAAQEAVDEVAAAQEAAERARAALDQLRRG